MVLIQIFHSHTDSYSLFFLQSQINITLLRDYEDFQLILYLLLKPYDHLK